MRTREPVLRRIWTSTWAIAVASGLAPWAAAHADPIGTNPDPVAAAPAIRVGDLATSLEQTRLQPAAGTRNWTLTPSLGLQEILTDNADTGRTGRHADIITNIQPGLLVNVDTQRLVGSVRYAPEIRIYTFEAHQNTVAHEFDGSATATLVPDTLFVDAHAYGTQQSASGGYAPNGTSNLGRNDRAQTVGFSVSPYVTHRFGGYGTATAGYQLSYTDQSGDTLFAPNSTTPYFVGNSTLTNRGFAEFRTGENLGRFQDVVRAQTTAYSGYGVLRGASRTTVEDEILFALNRQFVALASVGYENIRYSGTPATHISDPTWGVGLRYTPNSSSTITIRYSHHDGFNAPSLEAAWAITARTTLTASYSDTLGTDQTALQDALNASSTDSFGNPVDRVTGAPVQLTNQQLGIQTNLERLQRLAAGLTTTWDRDTVTFGVVQQTESVRATSAGVAAFSQRGWSVSAVWTHELTPTMSATGYVQYGRTTSPLLGARNASTATVDLILSRRLADNLFVNAQYIFSDRAGTLNGSGGIQNAIVLGLVKTF